MRGLVETEERKQELLQALGAVSRDRAVKVTIRTVAEASLDSPSQAAPRTVLNIEVKKDALLADPELRRKFAGAENQDEAIRRFANLALSQSRQARQHAWALKRLAERFSSEEMRLLTPEARAKWPALLRSHAAAFENQAGQLRQELQNVFASGAADDGGGNPPAIGPAINGEAGLIDAIADLFNHATKVDRDVRSALTASTETTDTAALKSPEFWRALDAALKQAAEIQKAASGAAR